MRQVKKCCRPIPVLLTIKIQKTYQDFQKTLEIKTRGAVAAAKPEVTTTTKNNGRGVNDHNTQEKLSCIKVGTTTILKFQQEIIPILKRDIQNFRGGNLKNHLTRWINATIDKILQDIIENGLKLDLIATPKSNTKFAFPLLHEEKLIVKKEVEYLKGT